MRGNERKKWKKQKDEEEEKLTRDGELEPLKPTDERGGRKKASGSKYLKSHGGLRKAERERERRGELPRCLAEIQHPVEQSGQSLRSTGLGCAASTGSAGLRSVH